MMAGAFRIIAIIFGLGFVDGKVTSHDTVNVFPFIICMGPKFENEQLFPTHVAFGPP
jgi:hypothetical protein